MGPFNVNIPAKLLEDPDVAEYLEYQARYINALRKMVLKGSGGSDGNSGGSGSNSGGSTDDDDYYPPIDPDGNDDDTYIPPVEPPPVVTGYDFASGGIYNSVCGMFVRVLNGGTVFLPDYPGEGCTVTVEWTSGVQPSVDTRTVWLFGVPGFLPQTIPTLGSSYTYLYLIEQNVWQLL